MGQPVFGKTAVNGIEYYICLEFSPNGDVYFLTAAKTNDKMYDEYKKEHGSERSINLGDLTSDSNRALSISNIQKLLGNVKNGNTLNQMAGENAKTAALDKLEQAKAMAGDRTPEDIYKATGWGSPPLTRERPALLRSFFISSRITPADAGKTGYPCSLLSVAWYHPR